MAAAGGVLNYRRTSLKITCLQAKKLLEYERAKARRQEEKELHARRERVARAQEANRRAAASASEGGDDGGEGFGVGPFTELFKAEFPATAA